MTIETELEVFRKNFPLTRVNVQEDFMVYSVRKGLADAVTKDANELIEELGLSLVAIPTALSAKDTVLIQSQFIQL